jgi:hypothetical protein
MKYSPIDLRNSTTDTRALGICFSRSFLAKGEQAPEAIGPPASCARPKRPHRSRAAEQRDELASFQLSELHLQPPKAGQ